MKATREDLTHVLNMVLLDNKGNTLTEALVIGIERSVLMYIGNIEAAAEAGVVVTRASLKPGE